MRIRNKYFSCILLLKLSLFLVFNNIVLYSQDIVVSEYYNISGYPNGEWTELLVINDVPSLTGYVLRDNSLVDGIPAKWQGGVRFKDHPLWKNMRRGTIIVIHHRGSVIIDDNKLDGYIEIGAEALEYFEKICFGCDMQYWHSSALSINIGGDIMELLDDSGKHIHSLSHMELPSGDYNNITNHKINFEGVIGDKESVCVVPGASPAAYSSGSDNSQANSSTEYITKGLPNKSNSSTKQNQEFWRKIREPNWNYPELNYKIFKDSIVFSWNSADDSFAGDSSLGYLLVRYPKFSSKIPKLPVDGKQYKAGDKYEDLEILANISNYESNQFTQITNLPCDFEYIYRLYVYCFAGNEYPETYARGRSYNEMKYAETTVVKKKPPTPMIISMTGEFEFCENDSLVLFCDLNENIDSYEWFHNEKKLESSDSDTIVVSTEGAYKVKCTNNYGCRSNSEEAFIREIPIPSAEISIDNNIIKIDTTIYLCEIDDIFLEASKADKILWLFNDEIVPNSNSVILKPEGEGEYKYIGINSRECADTSGIITLKIMIDDLSYSSDSISFDLMSNESSSDKKMILYNLQEYSIQLSEVNIPNNYEILATSFPTEIPGNDSLELNIRYTPEYSGEFLGKMIISKNCTQDTIILNGNKSSSKILLSSNNIDFGKQLFCDSSPRHEDLIVYNSGESEIKLNELVIKPPFESIILDGANTIQPKDSTAIRITFDNSVLGKYNEIFVIKYDDGMAKDSVAIGLNAESVTPEYYINDYIIDMGDYKGCVTSKDSSIKIINTGVVDIIFDVKNQNGSINYLNLPLIVKVADSVSLDFEFVPGSNGYDSIYDTLMISPCSIPVPLEFTSDKRNSVVNTDPDIINFGTTTSCNNNKITREIKIDFINTETEYAIIKKFDIHPPFESNLKQGDTLRENNLEIYFRPDNDGQDSGEAEIILDICDITILIDLAGNAENPVPDFNNFLDFNKVLVDEAKSDSIKFINNYQFPIIIDDIVFPEKPFLCTIDIKSLPLTINEFDSLTIPMQVLSDIPGVFKDSVIILSNEPCKAEYPVLLDVDILPKPEYEFTITLPELKSKPGYEFSWDITANFDDIYIDFEQISIVLAYNPTLIQTISVSPSHSSNAAEPINFSFSEDKGRLYIDCSYLYPDKIIPGELFNIMSKAFIGDSSGCEVIIDSLFIKTSENLIVTTNNSQFEIDSVCWNDFRNIKLIEGFPELIISNRGEYSEIKFKAGNQNIAEIKLYNTLGELVWSQEYRSGSNDYIIINTQNLDLFPGFYIVNMQYENHSLTRKMMIRR